MWGSSLLILFQPMNLLALFLGDLMGILVGCIPGLSGSIAMAMIAPLLAFLPPIFAIIFMVGLYNGAQYGGSISAILLGIPGTAVCVPTTFDGYPMTKKGLAGKALALSCIGSASGGIISGIFFIALAPSLARLSLTFGDVEYFALAILGLSVAGGFLSRSVSKGILSATFGLFLAMVGMGPITGTPRFTFGTLFLMNGLDILAIFIGLFALSTVIEVIFKNKEKNTYDYGKTAPPLPVLRDIPGIYKKHLLTIIKSGIIGTAIGIMPAAGGTTASLLAYGEASRSNRGKEEFGNGAEAGVVAPETANNATVGGALIPTLTLGIPGSETTAVMIVIMTMLGMRPGPMLFTEQPILASLVLLSILLSSILIAVIGFSAIKPFTMILRVPPRYLYPLIAIICLVGAFSLNNSLFDVWVAIGAGFFGVFMKRYRWPTIPFVLGLVLGEMAETSLRTALVMYHNDWTIFLRRPLSLTVLIIAVLILFYPFFKKKKQTKSNATETIG